MEALKCSDCDLEVLVGPNKKVYRYHKVIQASYSTFLDTMLSTDIREKDTSTIRFPDIQPEMWDKLIGFLEPGGYRQLKDKDIVDMLPIYDQYQFHQGLNICDEMIRSVLEPDLRILFAKLAYPVKISLAIQSYQLALPKSSAVAKQYAARMIKLCANLDSIEENKLAALFPLVLDDEETLKYVVKVAGKERRLLYYG